MTTLPPQGGHSFSIIEWLQNSAETLQISNIFKSPSSHDWAK